MSKEKMKHCAWCGDEIGMASYATGLNDPESCGKKECNREVNGMYQAERDEAHEQLDRDMGYY